MTNCIYKKLENRSKRTIVVGDIHGYFDELMELLEKVGFSEDDTLVSVGDMIDRGPFSWKVVDFFRDNPNAFSALGNHERRIAGTIRGTSNPAWTQLHTLTKIDDAEKNSYASYFESLPAVIKTEHAIITHGRLDPYKSFEDQNARYTCAVGGDCIDIETEINGIPVWYHTWKKANTIKKPICIGHIGYDRIELIPNELYALGTGAVNMGYLTAVVFPDNEIF